MVLSHRLSQKLLVVHKTPNFHKCNYHIKMSSKLKTYVLFLLKGFNPLNHTFTQPPQRTQNELKFPPSPSVSRPLQGPETWSKVQENCPVPHQTDF